MYKKTILALAVFAVILTWHASDAKLFLDEYELEEYQWDSLTKTGTGKTGTKASSTKAKKSGAKGGKKTDATKKPPTKKAKKEKKGKKGKKAAAEPMIELPRWAWEIFGASCVVVSYLLFLWYYC